MEGRIDSVVNKQQIRDEAVAKELANFRRELEDRRASAFKYFDSVMDTVKFTHDSHKEAHKREHELVDDALRNYQKAVDEKFRICNAFREQINQERQDYVRRDTMD